MNRIDTRLATLATALLSAVILGAALLSQFAGGLQPCVLCVYQRWPYVATILLGLAGFALARRHPGAARAALGLAGLVFFVGGGIAGFHVGVEQGWWQGTSGCGAPTGGAMTLEDLRAQVLAAPVVRCDEVPWSLLGISMAGYNFIISLALAGAALWAAARRTEDGDEA
jgi:disulfide bond formation protein DsbB